LLKNPCFIRVYKKGKGFFIVLRASNGYNQASYEALAVYHTLLKHFFNLGTL